MTVKEARKADPGGFACQGRPVGLCVPRSKPEKETPSKDASKPIVVDAKMNEENSKANEKTVKKKISDWSKMNIIDVCENKQAFNEFTKVSLQKVPRFEVGQRFSVTIQIDFSEYFSTRGSVRRSGLRESYRKPEQGDCRHRHSSSRDAKTPTKIKFEAQGTRFAV